MKKILVLFLYLLVISTNASGQCSGEIVLTTQAQVNAFPQDYGCVHLDGNLSIGVQTSWSTISNLDSLYQIETISGGLGIYTNEVLTDLFGLDNLESIGTYLGIRHCDSLINLMGLTNLDSIGGEANIAMNDVLVDLQGLESLEHSGGIILQYNPLLGNLSGLDNLITLDGLTLRSNASILNLEGLNANITNLEYFSIVENSILNDLSNLSELDSVEYYFHIDGNDSLVNLSAFNNLSTVGANMRIVNNQALVDIEGLKLLSIGGDFRLSGNSNLNVCCVVLDFEDKIVGELMIENNDTSCNSIEIISDYCMDVLGDFTLLNQNKQFIFPNPNQGQFYLKTKNETILSVSIQNNLGQVIFEQKNPSSILSIDLDFQNKGLYFVRIETSEGVFVNKMKIQ